MSAGQEFWEHVQSEFAGAPASPWHVYAALVLQANDRIELLGPLWEYVASITPEANEQITKARQMREALLKASVLVGFPKGINACAGLRKALLDCSPEVEKELDKDTSLRQNLSRSEKDTRGMAFFSKIYAQHTDRVLNNMSVASGGDLSEFAISSVYGDLMAEESRLGAKDTGLLEFLACYATGGSVWAQAKGHMYGCHNLGNGKAEIQAAVSVCKAIEAELKIQTRREPEENWSWLAKADRW